MISSFRQPIVFDGNSTPIKTALFIIICVAWILPGLFGHDPWKPDEALAFGVVRSMLEEGRWFLPTIAGAPSYDYPPLYYWMAALLAKLASPLLPLHDGARLATGVFMSLTLYYTHKTARRLLDERAGRIAVLLLVGCLGLLWRGHQMNPEIAGLAGIAAALYGMTRIRSEPVKGGVTTGLAAGAIALSLGIVPALAPTLIALALMAVLKEWNNRTFRRGIAVALLTALPFMLAYPIMLWLQSALPLANWSDAILGLPCRDLLDKRPIDLLHFIRILPWYGLPALPFALWLWIKERRKLGERVELALPFAAFVTLLVLISLTRKASDAMGLALLPPLALAAAHTPERLSRSLASFMDWFSLLFFGLAATAAWLYWSAAVTGMPDTAARAMQRQVPGFEFTFVPLAFAAAILMTTLWLYATVRAHRNNRRAIVNWAAGITLVWVLVNLLGLPAADYRLSYRVPVKSLAQVVATQPGCVDLQGVGDAQRASLDYFADIRDGGEQCRWLLTQGTRGDAPAVAAGWQLAWEGARPGDNDERLRLYSR